MGADFCVLSLDIWGHGQSSCPDGLELSPAVLLRLIWDCVERVLGSARKLSVIGFSHGAFLAALFASANTANVTRLVLVAPYACDLSTQLPVPGATLVATLALSMPRLRCRPLSEMLAVFRVLSALRPELWDRCARALRWDGKPILLVVGDADSSVGMRIVEHVARLQALLPRARLRTVPHCGHLGFFNGARSTRLRFGRCVMAFLRENSTGQCSQINVRDRS